MATVLHTLTVAEFEAQFGYEKPSYEFWYGEAIQKSMPTWMHGLEPQVTPDLLHRLKNDFGR